MSSDDRPKERSESQDQHRWRVDLVQAITGGVTAVLLGLGSTVAMGNISGAEALHLLGRVVDVLPYFCASAMTASATILALMLTLLGFGGHTDVKFSKRYFVRVRLVGRLAAIVFVFSMLLLLFVTIPLPDSDKANKDWFVSLYYITAAAASTLGGIMVFLILMLYRTVADVIEIVGLGIGDHRFVRSEKEPEHEDGK